MIIEGGYNESQPLLISPEKVTMIGRMNYSDDKTSQIKKSSKSVAIRSPNSFKRPPWSFRSKVSNRIQHSHASMPSLSSEKSLVVQDWRCEYQHEIKSPTIRQASSKTSGVIKTTATEKTDLSLRCLPSLFIDFLFYFIYASINVIISAPAFYGYATIIFSHEAYQEHMNTLSKLVVLSSVVHQLGFCLFSSLPYAIGSVQDAGLIFLSAMSTTIATRIIEDNGTSEQILSTTMVLLSISTASLGVVVILMGYFHFADAVSYLPMPVIGGYLAYIGYFCLMAGVGLCISKNMSEPSDWGYLIDPSLILLASPGLLSGVVFLLIEKNAKNNVVLPISMVVIPATFYLVLFVFGISINEARQAGWVGAVSPSVPATDLFKMVDFKLVRWDLLVEILPTWVGMVFVVSFASCLDVAAIAMDKGEALDTNKELTTVGICNLLSGLTFGFTGSYIFSQTIFTFRTGFHSRWIGLLVAVMLGYIVISPVNVLEVSPLFFLGSTLIFIGLDLLFEWIIAIRQRIFLSEYFIVLGTFFAIQIVGMDAGILIGVLFAIVDHVVHTAHTTGVYRIQKQSRTTWSPWEHQIIQSQGYNIESPKILVLEVVGSVFFASQMFILTRITEEIVMDVVPSTTSPNLENHNFGIRHMFLAKSSFMEVESDIACRKSITAKYVVLDLSHVTNLDASATRGCFTQLVKLAQRHGITVCACATSLRLEWMLRSHHAAYGDVALEESIKAQYFDPEIETKISDSILLFSTIHEALQFCEHALVYHLDEKGELDKGVSDKLLKTLLQKEKQMLSDVFGQILGSSTKEMAILQCLNGKRYHNEIDLVPGEVVFHKAQESEYFCVVLHGAVAVVIGTDDQRHREYIAKRNIISGAGPIDKKLTKANSTVLEHDGDEIIVASIFPVGGIFGYVDFLLGRPRNFTAVATEEGTVIAKISSKQMKLMTIENEALDACIQRVLLCASLLDLSNCRYDE